MRSTHQSHSAILPSDTASAINSPITFCHPPLRHGQCDQLTNHILPSPPPTRPVRSTHQSHSAILHSDTVSAINSPITFCHPPFRHGQFDQLTNHILPSSLRHGQCDQLTNHILPSSLRHGQCDQLTNHILTSSLRHGQKSATMYT